MVASRHVFLIPIGPFLDKTPKMTSDAENATAVYTALMCHILP